MNEQQAFVYQRPSFVAQDTLTNGAHMGLLLPAGVQWSIRLSLNVGLE